MEGVKMQLLKSKEIVIMLVSFSAIMMITAASAHIAFADPLHCDQPGWPSCYSVGYQEGLANPGTVCPTGHSDNFCVGWNVGTSHNSSRQNNLQPQQGMQTNATNPIVPQQPAQPIVSLPSTTHTWFAPLILSIIIVIIVAVIAWKIKHTKGRYRKRELFSESIKAKVLVKQDHRCSHCKRLLNVVDYDHKNGDRSDNRESNCVALCPNCHAIKTRSSHK
jgi:hypothetical protein